MAKRKTKPSGLVETLRQAIAECGLSHYAVAKASGVSAPVIGRFMSKERGLTIDTAAKLCEALGLELVKRW